MRRLSGQAARVLFSVLHRLCAIALALLVVASVAIAALAWRLSKGPIDLPFVATRIEAAVNQGQAEHLDVGSAALAWEGFHAGFDSPLEIRLDRVSLHDPKGVEQLAIPTAELTLSIGALLRGAFEPRTLVLMQPSITAERAADGTLSLRPGGAAGAASSATWPAATLLELARPPATDASRGRSGEFSQLRRVRIEGASLTLNDRELGVTWQVPSAELDVTRRRDGGVGAQAELALAVGDQHARVTGSASLPAGGTDISVQARISPVVPAALARLAPAMAPLSALDLPIGGEVSATLGPDLAPRHLHLALQADAGTAHIAGGAVPIAQAVAVVSGTPDRLAMETGRMVLPSVGGAPPVTLLLHGGLQRAAGRLDATLALDIDHTSIAALPLFWPPGIARDARTWIARNITAGVAHDGHFDIGLSAKDDFSDLALLRATGAVQGDALTLHWLRPVPPVVQGQVVLRMLDPDTIEIAVLAGQQAPATGTDALAVHGGSIRITGLLHHDQDAAIQLQVAGSVPAAIGLLRNPRLGLLSRQPIALNDPAGQVSADVTVSLPLAAAVTMDQVAIGAQAHLTQLHLAGIAAGHDLDQGTIDLTAGNDGLTISGEALLAGIPARLQASMDFRNGPAGQVLQRISVTGRPDARQLSAAGLDAGEFLTGPVPLAATVTERRGGAGTIELKADLTPAALSMAPLGWRKAAGQPATAEAVVLLDHDRLTRIDPIRVVGDGLDLNGHAEFGQGHLATLQIDRAVLGRTVGQGFVRFAPPGGPISATLSGSVLDLSGRFAARPPGAPAAAKTAARGVAGTSSARPGLERRCPLRPGDPGRRPQHHRTGGACGG